ncbi:MAG: DMT family transporter [Syntrophothermus sp.]
MIPFVGEISALITAFLWSGTSIVFSYAAIRIGSMQLNINRLILATIFLFSTVMIFGLDYGLSSSQIMFLSISGIIGLVIGDSFLFQAYVHIGPRLGILLLSSSPALSAILAYFFLGEGLNIIAVLGIIITMMGIALVILQREEKPTSKYKISRMGIFYGFMGALGQAGGLIFAKFAFTEGPINGFVATFFRIFAATILMIPIGLAARKFTNPLKVYANEKKALVSTVIGTIIGPFLGITFSLIAIAHTKVGIASTLMSTMPIIMLPLVKVVYKEELSWQSIVGALIAVTGIALLFLRG